MLLPETDNERIDYSFLSLEETNNRTNPQQENKIEDLLNKSVYNLSHLDVYWEEGTVAERRNIVGSIFPEN
jgi:hypothetical protein